MVPSARPTANVQAMMSNGQERPHAVIIVDKIRAVCEETNVECFGPAS